MYSMINKKMLAEVKDHFYTIEVKWVICLKLISVGDTE